MEQHEREYRNSLQGRYPKLSEEEIDDAIRRLHNYLRVVLEIVEDELDEQN